MRIAITGACGWIGRELTTELERGGHELRLFDRVDPAQATVFLPFSAERRLAPLVPRWPYTRGEITDETAVAEAVRGCDAVVHLAAATTGLPEHGRAIMEANVVGTWVVADAARRAGARRLFAASSINAYGTFYWRLSGRPVSRDTLPLSEAAACVPEDPYSLSKLQTEQILTTFHRAYGLETAAFRFAGVWSDEVWRHHLAGRPPTTAWSDDLWQWVHVADIVAGVRAALEYAALPPTGVYNLGAEDTRCAEPTLDLVRRFRPDLLEHLTEPLPARAALMSIAAARSAFGYAPRYRCDAVSQAAG